MIDKLVDCWSLYDHCIPDYNRPGPTVSRFSKAPREIFLAYAINVSAVSSVAATHGDTNLQHIEETIQISVAERRKDIHV